MSKKYEPSGYQMILVDVSSKISGNSYSPSTEDEEILLKLLTELHEGKMIKPVLLTVKESTRTNRGFAQITGTQISLLVGDGTANITFKFSYDDVDVFDYDAPEL